MFNVYSYQTVNDPKSKKGRKLEKVTVKGIMTILKERGLYRPKHPSTGQSITLDCKTKGGALYFNGRRNPFCCHSHILSNEPDFKNQQSALFEVVYNTPHTVELYPKFHCECNWIERYWGATKRIARENCAYNFSSLKQNLPEFMDQVPLHHVSVLAKLTICFINLAFQIVNFYNRCWRFISLYAIDNNGATAFAEVGEFGVEENVNGTNVHQEVEGLDAEEENDTHEPSEIDQFKDAIFTSHRRKN